MGMLAKIRRMHFRDHLPLREIARQTGLARNTIRDWLRKKDVVEPQYKKRDSKSVVDPWAEQLAQWLSTDRHRPKRDRRTAKAMYRAIQAQGYRGSYNRVCAYIKRWRAEESEKPGPAYVPLNFALGEAFQFDWSSEGLVIGGVYRKIELAHMKLCASRAFWPSRPMASESW